MRLDEFYKGKTIWVTGASAGIGKACAIALSKYDTTLILSARNADKLNETAKACHHKNIIIAAGDLSQKERTVPYLNVYSKQTILAWYMQ